MAMVAAAATQRQDHSAHKITNVARTDPVVGPGCEYACNTTKSAPPHIPPTADGLRTAGPAARPAVAAPAFALDGAVAGRPSRGGRPCAGGLWEAGCGRAGRRLAGPGRQQACEGLLFAARRLRTAGGPSGAGPDGSGRAGGPGEAGGPGGTRVELAGLAGRET
ncbi:hypothetical protein TPA0909_38830 [Streptomyces albus]|nr:hypothetical protein TPA0909_38830 [Streptomyces albus]